MTCRNSTFAFHQFATSVHSSEKEAHIWAIQAKLNSSKGELMGGWTKKQQCFMKWKMGF